jgi:hypothetical protein
LGNELHISRQLADIQQKVELEEKKLNFEIYGNQLKLKSLKENAEFELEKGKIVTDTEMKKRAAHIKSNLLCSTQ